MTYEVYKFDQKLICFAKRSRMKPIAYFRLEAINNRLTDENVKNKKYWVT